MTNPDSINEIATVRIELRDTEPLIWREVEVPTSITLRVLHDIIQSAMGWLDYHLWEFTIGGQTYGLPMDEDWGTAPRKIADKARLRDVLNSNKTVIDYLYDFGDSWEHRVIVTDIRVGAPQGSPA
ncbi:plasmid pRiA4b ORF-3-like family protein [Asticcacaulis biprosthecium C19]|uniref:Plasmid pRiA4b ORF-3-like family protein n=1 Tax=Asticcacaulis biprosthecium C19 TaxID=715226 RepID=F4QMF1_9CAUL|nr:plasmid pRiA4b ORF-3 family protein [Asticcacaulis biprosthecium]EGF91392.1 plasmid pRiA4b ORF-3-like family protein [Asticcacaulis biprosthecium C19]